jgi:aminopeptidase N
LRAPWNKLPFFELYLFLAMDCATRPGCNPKSFLFGLFQKITSFDLPVRFPRVDAGWKTYHDQWLTEGMAEHASALYLRQFEPNRWNAFWDMRRTWLLSKNNSGYRPVDAGPIWLNDQLNDHNQPRNSRLIYDKGAYVFEMLRSIMFDPKTSDGRYTAMMKDFTKTYAGQNASTEDFKRTVEKHIGRIHGLVLQSVGLWH